MLNLLRRIPHLEGKNAVWLCIAWAAYHWSIPFWGSLLPYPQPRLTIVIAALVIDGLGIAYLILWLIRDHAYRFGPARR